jgi:predicted AlkP superfamily pyrophosphatase or phosphodiesterase
MISVDGMKPEYVLEAEKRGLKIPYLRSLLASGTYADGVVGVWPTVTYPSHTSLVTGVAPAEHGIYNNVQFDPERKFAEAWYWYADQIRVPTLWQAAHGAGLSTASIGWPVSVDAADIDYLIPEFFRTWGPTEDLNPADRYLIAALSRPVGMLALMESQIGPYMKGNDTSTNGDQIKTRFALEILQRHAPRFMTLHLSSLDDAEHAHGPFSAEANTALAAIDTLLASLAQGAQAADPATVIVIVSDHGFASIDHKLNLAIPFIAAGLIEAKIDPETQAPRVSAWRAEPWMAGGMAAIQLHDPGDKKTEAQVAALLQGLQADPRNGIAEILDRGALARRGGFPDAAFVVVLKPGFYTGTNLRGELVTDLHEPHGGHGFSPEFPEMRAAFFASGAGIAAHRDLGVIDMRQIAPTVAALLGVSMPSAKAAPLHLDP